MLAEMETRWNSWNASCHSLQNLLPSWLKSKNVKCQMYRTVILFAVSCVIEIFDVPNRILQDTETGLFKTHNTGTSGIPISGRFPIRNPVGTQAIRLRFFVVFHSSWRQLSGYYIELEHICFLLHPVQCVAENDSVFFSFCTGLSETVGLLAVIAGDLKMSGGNRRRVSVGHLFLSSCHKTCRIGLHWRKCHNRT
jgi:hypothetical protein